MAVVVDDREQAAALGDALAARWQPVYVARLDVGDVEVGPGVRVERKTVADFSASLSDGRLFDQAARLCRGPWRPLLVVEGADSIPAAAIPERPLRGVLVSLLVAFRLPLLRTLSVDETAEFLAAIARQESRRRHRRAASGATPRPARRVALDVLGAIPGIGDVRARRLLRRFGSVPAVLGAPPGALTEVEGVGPSSAASIRAAADPPAPTEAPAPRRPPPRGPDAPPVP
ncbi:MAG: nuclease [Planctomycetes bacterium]|nr:nuclease [Planctomycetota bacterium]